jgi:hypothetical protein
MKTKGIRISDIKDGKCIPLSGLLENISDEMQFLWALLWLDVTSIKNDGKYFVELQKKINQSEDGLLITFESLLETSKKIFQEINLTIIACKTKENLHRYKEDREMYETCDIVIEMIDGGFWEVFSKNIQWIDQLAKKFQNIEFLTSDFQKRIYDK